MTAKESLFEALCEFSELDAERLLPLADPAFLEWLERVSLATSNQQYLEMSAPFQRLLRAYEARFYTAEDAALDKELAEEWEAGAGADLQLIDE